MMKPASSSKDHGSTGATGATPGETSRASSSSDWNRMLKKLAAFKERHGHCNVGSGSSTAAAVASGEDDAELAAWASKQRELNKPGAGDDRLTEAQVAQLTLLGFEWQPKNPRHLQWETRYGQLQAFKTKFGHVQVPIGWSENPQLANWVSKQRQEYKNLLRGRTTRLDETRIQLLNGVGFAWQLQRGGRRRQLKARKREAPTVPGGAADADGHASSDGSAGSNQDYSGGDKYGPCILPGEVLIGHGAPTSGEHEHVSGRTYITKDSTATNTMKKGGNQGKTVAMPQGLGTPPMHQPRMQQPLHSSFFTSSQLGLPISPRGATSMGGAANAHRHQMEPRNNDLHDLVLARNALYNNLQRQSMAGSAQGSPLLQQRLGMAGTFPNFDLQQSQQILAARAGLQVQAQNQYQQQQVSNTANRLLQASMQRQLSNLDASLGLSTGNATHAMANAPGPNPHMIAMLESAPGMHMGRRGTMEESKLSSDGVQPQAQQNQQLNLQNLNLQLLQQQFQQQQQQQQQQLQQHQQGRGGPSGGEQSGQQGSNRGFGGFFGGNNLS